MPSEALRDTGSKHEIIAPFSLLMVGQLNHKEEKYVLHELWKRTKDWS